MLVNPHSRVKREHELFDPTKLHRHNIDRPCFVSKTGKSLMSPWVLIFLTPDLTPDKICQLDLKGDVCKGDTYIENGELIVDVAAGFDSVCEKRRADVC